MGCQRPYQNPHCFGTPPNLQMEHRGHCDQKGEQRPQRLQRRDVQSAGQGLQVTEWIPAPNQSAPRYRRQHLIQLRPCSNAQSRPCTSYRIILCGLAQSTPHSGSFLQTSHSRNHGLLRATASTPFITKPIGQMSPRSCPNN